jgi:hypothetical protein
MTPIMGARKGKMFKSTDEHEDIISIEDQVTRVDLKKRGTMYILVTHMVGGVQIRGVGTDLKAALDEWNRVAGARTPPTISVMA